MCIFCEKAKNELQFLTPEQKREAENCLELQEARVPATILTGFLGAGKTTFLNFVLKSQHGKRIAVVQNEFGKVPIDDQLMLLEKSASETIVMPNGCLCCRVRGDLVEALRRLGDGDGDAGGRLDALLVECSGLSEVMPVAQTFFSDPFVQASFRLDSVLCMCDAGNFRELTAGDCGEDVAQLLKEQLAISDVCLLNKCDLISSAERDGVAQQIREVNPACRVVPCRHGKVNLGQVLKVNSFSLDGALSLDDHFLDGPGRKQRHAHHLMSSLGLESAGTFPREAVEEWLKMVVERSGKGLIRLKGVLKAASGSLVVQGVGGHVDVEEAETVSEKSRLVIIGQLTPDLWADLEMSFMQISKL